jgi:hypothetical protein
MDQITDLIGLNRSEPILSDFIDSLGDYPVIDSFGGLNNYEYPAGGLALCFDEKDELVTIFLYGADYDSGYAQYCEALPHGTSFSHRRSDILAIFGTPERTGPKWDRYAYGSHNMHLQYSNDGNVELITLMVPDIESRTRH